MPVLRKHTCLGGASDISRTGSVKVQEQSVAFITSLAEAGQRTGHGRVPLLACDRQLIHQPMGLMSLASKDLSNLHGNIVVKQEDHSGASAICSAINQSISSR
jgi:hypothetical protein